jgi:hypothetical protein
VAKSFPEMGLVQVRARGSASELVIEHMDLSERAKTLLEPCKTQGSVEQAVVVALQNPGVYARDGCSLPLDTGNRIGLLARLREINVSRGFVHT